MINLANAKWFKSSDSGPSDCVEVAFVDNLVAVRDSKNQRGEVLVFTPKEWQAFLKGVRQNEFDLSQR